MDKLEDTIVITFMILAQIPPIYIFIEVKGGIYLEDVPILLTNFILTVAGLSLIGLMLSAYFRKTFTPKSIYEPPLLAVLSTHVIYFIGFFWVLLETKPYVSIEENFIWCFLLAQLLPLFFTLILVALLTSPEETKTT